MSRINFSLRAIVLLYFYIHATHLWQYALNLPLALGLFFISYSFAIYVSYKLLSKSISKIKSLLLLISFPIFLELLRFTLWIIDLSRAAEYASLLVEWDLTFEPMRYLIIGIFYSTILFSQYRVYRLIEIAVRPFFFILIFWDMRAFQLSVYQSLLGLLLSLILYSSVEVALLSRLLHAGQSTKQAFVLTLKVLLFATLTSLLTLPWVYQKAKPHVRPSDGLLKFNLSADFDFADELPLESEISLGNRLLFLVRSETILEHGLLLKRLTMSDYDDKRGFKRLDGVDDYPSARHGNYQYLEKNEKKNIYSNLLEFYLVNLSSSAILLPYNTISYTRFKIDEKHQFKGIFKIESYDINTVKNEIYQRKAQIADNNDIYLSTNGISDDILHLAYKITANVEGDYAKALEIQRFFHDNFYYTLTPGKPMGHDELHYFLFNTKRGYCTYFATAMTLMARALGMPARMAGGFLISRDNQLLDFYAVTAAQSHAWVEIYFEEIGWIPFDPTSSQLYNNELLLSDSDRTLDQARRLLETISNLELKPATNFMTQDFVNYTMDKVTAFKFKRHFIAILLFIFILIIVINHYLRKIILSQTKRINKNTHRKILILQIQLWLQILDHQTWHNLLMQNEQRKQAVQRLFFDASIPLAQQEALLIAQHFNDCYMHFRCLPLHQRMQHLYSFSLWRFRRVLF